MERVGGARARRVVALRSPSAPGSDAAAGRRPRPSCCSALLPLVGNWRAASRAGEWATREWARDILNSVEPYGILITGGDNDTFPLWYAQEVEGVRRDVTVAVTSLLNTDWYLRGLLRRPDRAVRRGGGPGRLSRTTAGPCRRSPILSLTHASSSTQVPEYLDVREPQRLRAGRHSRASSIRGVSSSACRCAPTCSCCRCSRTISACGRSTSRARPAAYAQALGLDAYALTQGLATKIAPLRSRRRSRHGRGAGTRPHRRAAQGSRCGSRIGAPAAIIRRGDWVDRPSAGSRRCTRHRARARRRRSSCRAERAKRRAIRRAGTRRRRGGAHHGVVRRGGSAGSGARGGERRAARNAGARSAVAATPSG